MPATLINPEDLSKPVGYSHGAMGSGRVLFIAGQVGTDRDGKFVSEDLVAQFERAIANLVRVVEAARGKPEDIVKINLLVLNKHEYRQRAREIGRVYVRQMGRHYPAMTLTEIRGLWDDEAKVEIEAVAVLP